MLLRLDWFKIPAQYMLVFRCLCSCLCWAWCLMLNVTSMLTLKLHWGWCCCWYLHCSCRRSWCWILQRLRLFLPNSICHGWVWWAPFICSLVWALDLFCSVFCLIWPSVRYQKQKIFNKKNRSCESLTSKKQELDVLSKLQNLQLSSTSLRIQPARKGL